LLQRGTPGPRHLWAFFRCTSCGCVVMAKGEANNTATNAAVIEVIPAPKKAHDDIPEPARTFLQAGVRHVAGA
jgi:hypothetical protein